MPGVAGKGGRVPKRSTQRRRRNKEGEPDRVAPGESRYPIPPVVGAWHPAAKAWYRSLGESGQAQYFEPSDWQAAKFVAGELSVYLKSKRRSAMMLSHLWSAMGDLLATEASRRRVRIEIERSRPTPGDAQLADVTHLSEIRRRAEAG